MSSINKRFVIWFNNISIFKIMVLILVISAVVLVPILTIIQTAFERTYSDLANKEQTTLMSATSDTLNFIHSTLNSLSLQIYYNDSINDSIVKSLETELMNQIRYHLYSYTSIHTYVNSITIVSDNFIIDTERGIISETEYAGLSNLSSNPERSGRLINNIYADNEDVISYVFDEGAYGFDSKLDYIVININSDWIVNNLQIAPDLPFLIINNENMLIYSQGDPNYVEQIYTMDTEEYFQSSEHLPVFVQSSDLFLGFDINTRLDCRLIVANYSNDILAPIIWIRWLNSIIIVSCFVLLMLISFLILKRFYPKMKSAFSRLQNYQVAEEKLHRTIMINTLKFALENNHTRQNLYIDQRESLGALSDNPIGLSLLVTYDNGKIKQCELFDPLLRNFRECLMQYGFLFCDTNTSSIFLYGSLMIEDEPYNLKATLCDISYRLTTELSTPISIAFTRLTDNEQTIGAVHQTLKKTAYYSYYTENPSVIEDTEIKNQLLNYNFRHDEKLLAEYSENIMNANFDHAIELIKQMLMLTGEYAPGFREMTELKIAYQTGITSRRLFGTYGNDIDLDIEHLIMSASQNNTLHELQKLYKNYFYTVENQLKNITVKAVDSLHARVVDEVQAHLENPNLSIVFVSEKLGYSPVYLGRIFKKEAKISLTEYIVLERIKKVKELLVGTDMEINRIAESCGFISVSNFFTLFKKHEHTTPKAFRMLHR